MDDHALTQGYTDPGRQVAVVTEFCTMMPKTCGSSTWNSLHVTLRAPSFEVASRFLENTCTLALTVYRICNEGSSLTKMLIVKRRSVQSTKLHFNCEIRDPINGVAEDSNILRCDAVSPSKHLPTFWRIVVPSI
jgi:hypothetical protein